MFGLDPACFSGDVAQLNCLPSTVLAVANAFLIFSGTTALFIIAWSGIRMITAGADAKQIDTLKKAITFAIVGLIIVLASFSIVNLIGYATQTSDCVTNLDALNTGCPDS